MQTLKMKLANLTILLLILSFSLKNNAQITITNADLPGAGDIFIYDLSNDLLSEDFSMTGAGYTWNYSSAQSSNVDTLSVVSVGSTPVAYQYYFNNQWTQPDHYSDYAQPGQDIDAMGQVTITDRFDYFGINTNSLEMKGFGAKVNGVPASVKYDTIDQIYPFPMTFGMNTHNSVGYYLASVPNMGTYGQWIRREVTVDGYGSLTTPNATYSNTLRVKTVLLQTDTVYVDQFMYGQTFDRPEEIIYEWFTNTEKMPVMKVVLRNGQPTEAKYLLEITSGTDELFSDGLSLLTLDENGIYQVVGVLTNSDVVIYDVNGKCLGHSSQNNIDLRDATPGLYFIIVRNEASSHCFKVVK